MFQRSQAGQLAISVLTPLPEVQILPKGNDVSRGSRNKYNQGVKKQNDPGGHFKQQSWQEGNTCITAGLGRTGEQGLHKF